LQAQCTPPCWLTAEGFEWQTSSQTGK